MIGLISAGIVISIGSIFYQQIIRGIPVGDTPLPDTALILLTIFAPAFMALIAVMMYSSRLETRFERYGISYRFLPFIRSWKFISKESIQQWEVKRYIPPGYGIRFGFKFLTLNVSGTMGLELILHDRKNIRLGTQRPEEVKKAMERMFNPEE